VKLVPDHRSVEAIARQVKASGRAYSVFDVGRLFMDSRERYQVQFSRQPAPQERKPKPGEPAPAPAAPQGPQELYQCPADQSLWLTREEAIRHVLHSAALTKYYRTETVTTEAPKGNFSAIAVCGFSGAILGPPNHHDFQRNVARLYRERFSDMSLERYKSRIRTEKDEALLQKWMESQTTAKQFVPVTTEPLPEGAEPPAPLKSDAEMEAHFLKHHAAEAAVPITKATVPGNIPGKALSAPLLALLRVEVERQNRFPMQLVQDLCRDLENQGLKFFKRDKKTTFVCRNRPHFLPDDLVLSDRIRALVEMVRFNPGITYTRLVSTLAPHAVQAGEASAAPSGEAAAPQATPDAPAAVEAVAPGVTEPAAVAAVEPAPVPEPVTDAVVSLEPDAAADAVPAAENAPAAEAPAAEETSPAPAEAAPATPLLSPEEIAILQDLRWLVQEGYVTEFQSGELYVLGRPPQPQAPKKAKGPKPQAEAAAPAEETPAAGTESAENAEAAAESEANAPEAAAVEAVEAPASEPEAAAPAEPEGSTLPDAVA